MQQVLVSIDNKELEEKLLEEADSSAKKENKEKILKLYGQWDGEVDGFLKDFYERRQRRGRLE